MDDAERLIMIIQFERKAPSRYVPSQLTVRAGAADDSFVVVDADNVGRIVRTAILPNGQNRFVVHVDAYV